MTSRVGEAKNFLDEVRSQFKAGNLMLYEQAVKNLEKFYEVTAEKETGSFQTFVSRQQSYETRNDRKKKKVAKKWSQVKKRLKKRMKNWQNRGGQTCLGKLYFNFSWKSYSLQKRADKNA